MYRRVCVARCMNIQHSQKSVEIRARSSVRGHRVGLLGFGLPVVLRDERGARSQSGGDGGPSGWTQGRVKFLFRSRAARETLYHSKQAWSSQLKTDGHCTSRVSFLITMDVNELPLNVRRARGGDALWATTIRFRGSTLIKPPTLHASTAPLTAG